MEYFLCINATGLSEYTLCEWLCTQFGFHLNVQKDKSMKYEVSD